MLFLEMSFVEEADIIRMGTELTRSVWKAVLDVDLPELEDRVNNLDSRGLVNPDGIGFAELYHQRLDLYRQYADVRIDCTGKGPREIAREIVETIKKC